MSVLRYTTSVQVITLVHNQCAGYYSDTQQMCRFLTKEFRASNNRSKAPFVFNVSNKRTGDSRKIMVTVNLVILAGELKKEGEREEC